MSAPVDTHHALLSSRGDGPLTFAVAAARTSLAWLDFSVMTI
jgi:hypothetical protein